MKLVIDETVINTKHIVEVSTISGLSAGGQLAIKLDNGVLVRSPLSTDIELNIAKMFLLYGYKLGNDTVFFNKNNMLSFMRSVLNIDGDFVRILNIAAPDTIIINPARLDDDCKEAYSGFNKKDPSYKECCDFIDILVRSTLAKAGNEEMKWHEAFYVTFNLGKRERFVRVKDPFERKSFFEDWISREPKLEKQEEDHVEGS